MIQIKQNKNKLPLLFFFDDFSNFLFETNHAKSGASFQTRSISTVSLRLEQVWFTLKEV